MLRGNHGNQDTAIFLAAFSTKQTPRQAWMFSRPDRESWVIPGVNGSTHPHSASLWQHWCGQKPSLFPLCLLYGKYLSACGFLYGAAEQAASVCLSVYERGAFMLPSTTHSSVIRRQRYKLTVRYYKLCLHEHNNCSFRSNYCILTLPFHLYNSEASLCIPITRAE